MFRLPLRASDHPAGVGDLAEEPDAGAGPPLLGGRHGNARHFGGLLKTHPREIAQLHQFGFPFIDHGKWEKDVFQRLALSFIEPGKRSLAAHVPQNVRYSAEFDG